MATDLLPVVVAFSGSREFANRAAVRRCLQRLRVKYRDLRVSVGDARGLDKLVREECGKAGVPFKVHYAKWEELGKRAGHERNGRVLIGAAVLFAFFDSSGPTPGTADCVAQARAASIPVFVYHDHLKAWTNQEG